MIPITKVIEKQDHPYHLLFAGIANDVIHHINRNRKDLKLEYDQLIDVKINCSTFVMSAITFFSEEMKSECLIKSAKWTNNPLPQCHKIKNEFDGDPYDFCFEITP